MGDVESNSTISNLHWGTLYLLSGLPRIFVVVRVPRVTWLSKHEALTARFQRYYSLSQYQMLWLALGEGVLLGAMLCWLLT